MCEQKKGGFSQKNFYFSQRGTTEEDKFDSKTFHPSADLLEHTRLQEDAHFGKQLISMEKQSPKLSPKNSLKMLFF